MNYTREEVLKACIEYFQGDELAATTWMNKYALKDGESFLELTPDDMHRRLASELARIENNYPNPVSEDLIFSKLEKFRYIVPQGGSMAGIGNTKSIQSLSNCFVVGDTKNADSYGSIFKTDQELVQLMKRRGGVGTDLSGLRPAGSKVTNAAATSSGLVSFMERFSNSTREVAQQGRRGALMLSCSILHPDAEMFIDAKVDTTKITGANVSVKITDEFMKCVKSDEPFLQRFPIDATVQDLFGPGDHCVDLDEVPIGELLEGHKPGTYYRWVNARKLWNKIIHNAWKSAEPGVLFWDTIINESPSDQYADKGYTTLSTNPCLHPDSLILMADGTKKPIKDIITGDRVVSRNLTTNEDEVVEVVWSGKTKSAAKLVQCSVGGLKCTPDHKIYDPLRGSYVEAKDCTCVLNQSKLSTAVFHDIDEVSDVYDINLSDNHNFYADGVLVHNCGELPLCPYDSCRLFAINLYSYVLNPFTEDAKFDFVLFSKDVILAQRLMDDMVDLEIEKIDQIIEKVKSDPESSEVKSVELNLWTKIRKKCVEGRRTGLGVTAEGDMLAALGLRYGSEDAIDMCTRVHKSLACMSYISSITLASERGAFKDFNRKKDLSSNFTQRVSECLSSVAETKWIENGRRNIANLTLAPTGSTSLMTQTTSGIEPAFRVVYKRRRKTTDPSRAVFTDANGDMFEEYLVFHHKFVEWYKVAARLKDWKTAFDVLSSASDDDIQKVFEESPYYQSTANDIDWVAKVKMQGEIQKWIDHSISCTVNMPRGTTEDTVADVYMAAWESGCKGVTCYVDGSRDGVLVDTTTTHKDSNHQQKKRPESIDARIVRFRNGSENWVAFIGMLDGKPWEIFTGKIDDDIKYLPKSVDSGRIVRVIDPEDPEQRRYDFIYEIGFGYTNALPDIGSAFNPEYYNYARFVSALLQEGTEVDKIVTVVSKLRCGDTINIWNRGVARALKKFISDGTKSGQTCPHCGSELVYYNGCTTCPGCGQGGKCD